MRRMHFAWARGLGLWVLFQFFWAKVLLCSPGQPQVCSNSSSSASYILGLQVCINMPASWKMDLKYSLFLFLFMRAGPYNGLAGKEKAVRIFGRRLQDEVADPPTLFFNGGLGREGKKLHLLSSKCKLGASFIPLNHRIRLWGWG